MDVGMSLQRLHTAQLTENFPLGISDVSAEREIQRGKVGMYTYSAGSRLRFSTGMMDSGVLTEPRGRHCKK